MLKLLLSGGVITAIAGGIVHFKVLRQVEDITNVTFHSRSDWKKMPARRASKISLIKELSLDRIKRCGGKKKKRGRRK